MATGTRAVRTILALGGRWFWIPWLGALLMMCIVASRGEATSGDLTQWFPCVSEFGSNGDCTDGVGLGGPQAVTVSPDGKHVYASSNQAVAAFARNKMTGALTQLTGLAACVSQSGGACTDGVGLGGPQAVTVSPDGKHVYVASELAVAAFARNKTTGALTQLTDLAACVKNTGSSGLCTPGVGLLGGRAVTVSPDGKHVYVASEGSAAVAAFARNKTTGALTQLPDLAACVSQFSGACTPGVGLDGAQAVRVLTGSTSTSRPRKRTTTVPWPCLPGARRRGR